MVQATVQRARDAYARHDWTGALVLFHEADSPDPEDRYACGSCSWWLGDLEAAFRAMEDAYRGFRAAGASGRAAMVALEVGYTHLLRGAEAPGLGWFARARADATADTDGPHHGYFAHVDFEGAFGAGDLDAAEAALSRVAAVAEQHADPTLAALALTDHGRVLLRRARVSEGVSLLDQAMVAALHDVDDPSWAGNIYCHLMAACVEVNDLRRAAEWTEQTARWCETMPGAGPFLGICRVHRAQILQLRGRWDQAERETVVVCDELRGFDVAVVAEAHCLQGDLRRLRGDLAGAALAYAEARALGRDPLPGTALLALARGDARAAVTALEEALVVVPAGDAPGRAKLLPTLVEAALAHGDLPRAEAVTAELEQLADAFETVGLRCAAATARARVLLVRGRPGEAQESLESAVRGWAELDAPYELARALQLCADAREAGGDRNRARLDRQAARVRLTELGVAGESPSRVASSSASSPRPTGEEPLTARERQVLALVAEGRSNQDVADVLVLSVRTVERHLEGVYRKLGVSGRSARVAAARTVALDAGDRPPDGMGAELGGTTHPPDAGRS